ncbi:hypothetical protein, partial [Treponema saccharophilum]|uniref:hypothetical protein n=1 Tax=Treponema saccharophilum TaxID=165 RepID=UPI00386C9AB2
AGAQRGCALFGTGARCFSAFVFWTLALVNALLSLSFRSERMHNSVAPFLERGRVVFLLSFFLLLALVNARLSLSSVASGGFGVYFLKWGFLCILCV